MPIPKKIVLALIAIILSFLPFAQSKSYAAYSPPADAVEVKCPSGTGKCYRVNNPALDGKTITVKKPSKPIPSTRPGTVPAVFLIGLVLDEIEKTEAGKIASDTFWKQVDKVDLAAGRIMDKVVAATGNTLITAWDDTIQTKNNWMTLSQPLFDLFMKETIAELSKDELLKLHMAQLNTEKINNPYSSSLSTKLTSLGYTSYTIITMYSDAPRMWYSTVIGKKSTGYRALRVGTFTGGSCCHYEDGYYNFDSPEQAYAWMPASDKTVPAGVTNIMDSVLSLPSIYHPDMEKNSSDVYVPGLAGTSAPAIPGTATIDGSDYWVDVGADGLPIYRDKVKPWDPSTTYPQTVVVDETGALVGAGSGTDTETGSISKPTMPKAGTINWKPLIMTGNTLTKKFPFSIPWDLSRQLSIFNVSPVAPKIEIDFRKFPGLDDKANTKYTIDFKNFDVLATAIRWFITILVDIGFILMIRKLLPE